MNTRPLAILSALAIANALYSHAIAEETLGRLFFTPEKRQALDHQRQFNIQEKVETQHEPTFTINGVVTRSSGKQTVWINSVAHDGRKNDESPQAVIVTPNHAHPGEVVIQPEDSPTTTASVGDTVDRTTGEVTGLLQGGRINIRTLKQ